MKRIHNIASVFMALVILLTLFPPAPAQAWTIGCPVTLNRSKLNLTGEIKKVTLKIDNMSFKGTLGWEPLTDEELADVIAQVANSQGMGPAQFNGDFDQLSEAVNKMNANTEMTPEKIQKMKDDIITLAKAVPGAGQAVAALEGLDAALNGDDAKAVTNAVKTAKNVLDTSLKDIEKEMSNGEGMGEKPKAGEISKAITSYNAAKVILDRFEREVQEWKDLQEGLDAKKALETLYGMINQKIEEYLGKSGKKLQISFDHAKAWTLFHMFGEQAKQNWDIKMTLEQIKVGKTPLGATWPGTYQGYFRIIVDYDMTDIRDWMPITGIYNMGAASTMLNDFKAEIEGTAPVIITMSDPGTCSAKRDIIGEATVNVSVDSQLNTNASINLDVKQNEKIVDISGIKLDVSANVINSSNDGTTAMVNYSTNYEISADENHFNVTLKPLSTTFTGAGANRYDKYSNIPSFGTSIQVPWSGDIWQASDKPTATIKIGG